MTCAGIASLVIADDKIDAGGRRGRGRADPVLPAERSPATSRSNADSGGWGEISP